MDYVSSDVVPRWRIAQADLPSVWGAILTTAEAKAHLRVTHTLDDTYIDALISAAAQWIQQYTGRMLKQQTILEYVGHFPANNQIELHAYPLVSLTSVKYYDTDDVQQTLSGTAYWSQIDVVPPTIKIKEYWPTTRVGRDWPIVIEYEAGTASAANITPDVLHAAKLLIGWWYEHPSDTGTQSVPAAAKALLQNHRLYR